MKVHNDTIRKAFRQCQLLRGDETGPKGRCEGFVAGTAYIQGQQFRVCDWHLRFLKRQREEQEAAHADRQRETGWSA